jgi:hypothetical protein
MGRTPAADRREDEAKVGAAPPRLDLQELSAVAGVEFTEEHRPALIEVVEFVQNSPELRRQNLTRPGRKRRLSAIGTRARQLRELLEEELRTPHPSDALEVLFARDCQDWIPPLQRLERDASFVQQEMFDGRTQYSMAIALSVYLADAAWRNAGGDDLKLGINKNGETEQYEGRLLALMQGLFKYAGVPIPSGKPLRDAAKANRVAREVIVQPLHD